MIITKIIFGIIGNMYRKTLVLTVLFVQSVVMMLFSSFESYYAKLHILLILVQSLMSIVILIKIWIIELSNINDRDYNISQ